MFAFAGYHMHQLVCANPTQRELLVLNCSIHTDALICLPISLFYRLNTHTHKLSLCAPLSLSLSILQAFTQKLSSSTHTSFLATD